MIDPAWRKDKGVTFTFVSENNLQGRMFASSLIPYLRTVNPWYLSMFSEDARNRHCRNHWEPTKNQLFSTDESGMNDHIYIDDNLYCSDEPMTTRPAKDKTASNNPDIQVDIPVLKDTDSISTF